MNPIEKIDDALTELKRMNQGIGNALSKAAPGTLMVSKNASSVAYFKVTYEDGKRRLQGIASDKDLVYRLAHEEYLRKMRTRVEENIDVLEYARACMKPLAPEDIFKDLPKNYDALEAPAVVNPYAALGGERAMNPSRDQNLRIAKLGREVLGMSACCLSRSMPKGTLKKWRNTGPPVLCRGRICC